MKNEILASLVATRDNNINSLNDLMGVKLNAFVLNPSNFYNDFIKTRIPNYQHTFQPVNYKQLYSQQTLVKILKGTHALIYVENKLNHIYMINYKYPLYLSRSGLFLLLRGFIMKKSIDKTIQDKIKKA